MKHFYIILIWLAFISCKNEEVTESISNPKDYNSYLFTSNHKTYTRALSEKEFWSKRLRPDSSGVGDLGPLGNAYTLLFETNGDITYLKSAEKIYRKAIAFSANNKDIFIRSLAQNLISQHRFKEAKLILEESYKGMSNKRATRLLLFDVYLEIGNYRKADKILGQLKNTSDFNYLIRLAKWNDHNGELEAAIRNLEEAKINVDSRNSKPLQIWTYTNLADYYGHAGRIQESYELYLKALEIQPDNSYAKKQIAWIAYSYDKNTEESSRILDSIMVNHKAPDYYLMKAEMLKFNGLISKSDEMKKEFVKAVNRVEYGHMYNSPLIEIYSETNPKEALIIALKELKNRATPQVYTLLAYSQLKNGNKEVSLETVRDLVEGKTLEPKSVYFVALIYNANGNDKKVIEVKEKLKNSSFELGPMLTQIIEAL